jgi:putative sugar O-methyltransferase
VFKSRSPTPSTPPSVDELLQAIVAFYEAPGFMHHAMSGAIAPLERLAPDPPTAVSLDAASRVTEAYHRARADEVSPGISMWTYIERRHSDFLTALNKRNVKAVQAQLGAMFTNGLTYGIARLSFNLDRDAHYVQLRCTDALRSLAESCGAERSVSLEQQGPEAQRNALQVDLDRLLRDTERITGLDLSCVPIGAGHGCRVAGRLINTDSLLHSYTVNRLRGLGASPESTIIEIGGGYGCLADLFARAGLRCYAIYDLPWVNVMQGYYLIMALPDCDVRLYGENRGDVAVLPFWRIRDLAPKSVDYVININSLPEMDAAIAQDYMTVIGRILRRSFLSINQEGMAANATGPQNWVHGLAAQQDVLTCRSRHPWWMEQGYVEELYETSESPSRPPS